LSSPIQTASVRVSGPEEVFGLIALANDALPDADPRKFTHADLALLRHAMASLAQKSVSSGDQELGEL
jgi:hypothetical protein